MAQTEPTSAEQDRAALLSVVTEKGGGGGGAGRKRASLERERLCKPSHPSTTA